MELFDSTNEYYANSFSKPTLPLPQFKRAYREIHASHNKPPNYTKFQPLTLHVLSTNRPTPTLTCKSTIIDRSPFMVKVNFAENE